MIHILEIKSDKIIVISNSTNIYKFPVTTTKEGINITGLKGTDYPFRHQQHHHR